MSGYISLFLLHSKDLYFVTLIQNQAIICRHNQLSIMKIKINTKIPHYFSLFQSPCTYMKNAFFYKNLQDKKWDTKHCFKS